MERAPGLASLLVLVVLAGCGGIVGDDSTESVTPAPVPTTQPPVVPGVTSDAVDAETVVDRHERALANTSFTMRSRYRARTPGGEVQYLLVTTATRGPDGRFLFVRREPTLMIPGQINATRIWWGGDQSLFRYTYGSGSDIVHTIEQRAVVDLDRSGTLTSVFADATVTRVDRLPAGGAEVAGRLTNRSSIPTGGLVKEPQNASFRAHVRPDGVVAAVAVGYDGTYRGNRTEVRYTIGFENVGSTTVTPPDWAN